jgi:hypothetical protein
VRNFFCSPSGCAGGCRCDEFCVGGRCTRLTCSDGSQPCPCQCCPAGYACVGGSACVMVPG